MTRARTYFIILVSILIGMLVAGRVSYPTIAILPIALIGWLWLFVLFALLVIWRRWTVPLVSQTALILAMVLLGALYTITFRHVVHPPNLPYEEVVELKGEIVTFPHIRGNQQDLVLEVRSDQITPFRLRVVTDREPRYRRGQTLAIIGRIEAPRAARDGFHEALFLEEQRIYGVMRWPDEIMIEADAHGWIRNLDEIRTRIEGMIQVALPEPAASLAAGLVLGIRPDRIDSFYTALQRTNLTHLAAVSGQNLSLTILVLFAFLRRIWLRPAIFVTGGLLLIYTLLVGAEASVVRAALMCFVLVTGPLFGRPSQPMLLLTATAVIMSFVNPLSISHDLGFQLSFSALLGIVLLVPFIQEKIFFLPAGIAELAATILAASAAVLPLQLVIFGELSLVGPLANLVVGPFIPLAMGGVLVANLAGFVAAGAAHVLLIMLYPVLALIVTLTLALGQVQGGFLEIGSASWVGPALLGAEWLLFMSLAWRQLPKVRDETT